MADRLANMGYNVEMTGDVNRKDGGVDIIATPKNGIPFILAAQVKHHRSSNRKTPVGDIRDFAGVLTAKHSRFALGVLVTNTAFTADAKWFAQQHEDILKLRDMDDLRRWLAGNFTGAEEWKEVPDTVTLAPGITIKIPKQAR